jgi:hypothetical protein
MDIVPALIAITTVRASSSQAWGQAAQWSVAMETLRQNDGRFNRDDAPQGVRTQDADRHAKCLHHVEFALNKSTQLGNFTCDPPISNTRVKPHPQGNKVACGELCKNSVGATFFATPRRGVIRYEPFGGLYAGLEMILRCGIPVTKYL